MKAVYPPFFIRVSRAAQQAWLKHIEAVGYVLTHKVWNPGTADRGENWVAKTLPMYETHCVVAKSDYCRQTRRMQHWIIVRLPDTAKAWRRRHPVTKKQKARPCPKRRITSPPRPARSPAS